MTLGIVEDLIASLTALTIAIVGAWIHIIVKITRVETMVAGLREAKGDHEKRIRKIEQEGCVMAHRAG